MEFRVEFYETGAGGCPVRDFLDELKSSDPDDFAAVMAGLEKLRNREYHREPLCKALGNGLFELRRWQTQYTGAVVFCKELPYRCCTRFTQQRKGNSCARYRNSG